MSTPNPPPDESGEQRGAEEAAPQLPASRPRPSSDEVDEALNVIDAELTYRTDAPDTSKGLTVGMIGMAARQVSGPAPSSSEMAGYKAVDPRLPERIMDGVDEERRHRHAMETRVVHADALVSVLGTASGVLFVIVALAIAAYAINQGSAAVAIVAIVGSLSPVAIALINRGRSHDGD